jgi:hypothetical protein
MVMPEEERRREKSPDAKRTADGRRSGDEALADHSRFLQVERE